MLAKEFGGGKERYHGIKPGYDPGFDSFGWRRLKPEEFQYHVARIEMAFAIYPCPFREIVEIMVPDEVWVRMGEEIRFVWQNGGVRDTLDFVQIDHPYLEGTVKFQISCSVDGIERLRFWSSCPDFQCLPLHGTFAPRIMFNRHDDDPNVTSKFLLVVMRRGHGGSATFEKRGQTIWVG